MSETKEEKKARKALKKEQKLKKEGVVRNDGSEELVDKAAKKGSKEKADKKEKVDKKEKKEKKEKKREKKLKEENIKDSGSDNKIADEIEKEKNVETKPEQKQTGASSSSIVVKSSSSSEIAQFLKSNSITIDVPTSVESIDPVLSISQFQINSELQTVLSKFTKPTPIQSAAWPYLLAGRDVVGVAETGSGKTLAFGIPAVAKLMAAGKQGGTCLVVSPTRELAMQIHDQFEELLRSIPSIKSVCLYGGVSKYDQQQLLRDPTARIIVGTPGRLRDLLAGGSFSLKECSYLVLDEADRMLEKGFEQDITEILGCAPAPASRQTVMFTATWPPEVRELASSFMKPDQVVKISIGEVDELHANKRIDQIVEVIDPTIKERKLVNLLRKYSNGKDKVLVFALYKKEASRIQRMLEYKGYKVAAVHGDLNQQQRTTALNDFKQGRTNLMLATDVAARGLDIPAVKVVINLTFPLTVEDYVHRIGRTGRAGQSGIAHTIFTEQEKHLAGALVNVLRDAGQPVPEDLIKFGTHTKKKEHSLYGAFFKNVDPSAKAKKVKFD